MVSLKLTEPNMTMNYPELTSHNMT